MAQNKRTLLPLGELPAILNKEWVHVGYQKNGDELLAIWEFIEDVEEREERSRDWYKITDAKNSVENLQ